MNFSELWIQQLNKQMSTSSKPGETTDVIIEKLRKLARAEDSANEKLRKELVEKNARIDAMSQEIARLDAHVAFHVSKGP
jgi:hypothetical protein